MAHQQSVGLINLKSMYNSGSGSDLTIVCGELNFPVHRGLIQQQDGYFKAMFKSDSPFLEGSQKVVNLTKTEIDPRIVEPVLEYIYGFPLAYPSDAAFRDTPACCDEGTFFVQCYAAGRFFQIPRFRDAALVCLRSLACLDHQLNTDVRGLRRKLAGEYNDANSSSPTLIDYVNDNIQEAHTKAAKTVLDTAPLVFSSDFDDAVDLRGVLTTLMINHFNDLKANDREYVLELLESAPGLSIELNMRTEYR